MAQSANIAPIKSSTQDFLEVEDIKDGIVILKDGSCVLVIFTTAINFGLLSEKEQDTSIYSYAALLNSLTFPIQILIRSKGKDISSYLKLLEERERKIPKKALREQIQKYKEFVEKTIQVNNVLEKKFYIIIPMSFLEIGIGKTLGSKLRKQKRLPYPKEYILEKARTNLFPKRDHLFRLLNRLGLRSRQMGTQELVRLFFGIYNPDSPGQALAGPKDYQTPLVKPAADFLPATKRAVPKPPVTSHSNQTSQPASTENQIIKKPEPLKPAQPRQVQKPAPGQEMTIKAEEVIKEVDQTTQKRIDQLVKTVTTTGPVQSQASKPIFDSNSHQSQDKTKKENV